MKIDKIMVLNLNRATERLAAQYGIWESRKVPVNKIHRFRALDLTDFKSAEYINEACQNAGYDWLVTDPVNPRTAVVKLAHYNHLRVLTKIANGTETVLFQHDDCVLHQDWDDLLADLEAVPPEVDILWLNTHWKDPRSGYHKDMSELKNQLMETPTPKMYKNFGSYSEKARVFTPKGASRFLSLCPYSYDEGFYGEALYEKKIWLSERTAEFIPFNIFHDFTPLDRSYCQTFYCIQPNPFIRFTNHIPGPFSYVFPLKKGDLLYNMETYKDEFTDK